MHRIAVLSKAHQLAKEPNPCADPLVRELLGKTRAAPMQSPARAHTSSARSPRIHCKPCSRPATTPCEEDAIAPCSCLHGPPAGGDARKSAATLENLRRVDAKSYLYTLAHSKTNQAGADRPEDVKPLVGSAAAAMQDWLAVLKEKGIKEGASSAASAREGIWANRWRQPRCATS